ncbi:MAG: metal ABC transporter permease [Opitutales bacterium]
MTDVIEIFQAPFMQRALAALLLAGLSGAVVGAFIVLRRMAFMGGALTHTILPGVVAAYALEVSLYLGAFAAALLTAAGVNLLAAKGELREDTAIGVMLSGMFALGVLLMALVDSFADFSSILFGNILAVAPGDLWLIGGITAFVLLCVAAFYKELELSTVDPAYCEQIGAHPGWMRVLILVLTAASVVSALKLMGALLTTALLLIPAATATLFGRSLAMVIVIGAVVATVGGVGGMVLSVDRDWPAASSIVLVLWGCFTAGWLFKRVLRFRRTGGLATSAA